VIDTAGRTAALITVGRVRYLYRQAHGREAQFIAVNPEDARWLKATTHACCDRVEHVDRAPRPKSRDLADVIGIPGSPRRASPSG
jgi:hypothetical protein